MTNESKSNRRSSGKVSREYPLAATRMHQRAEDVEKSSGSGPMTNGTVPTRAPDPYDAIAILCATKALGSWPPHPPIMI
jgi:hypothetical protein